MDRIARSQARRRPFPVPFVLGPILLLAQAATPQEAAAISFHPPNSYTVGNQPYSVAVGDLNGDGKPDVVTANYSSGGGNTASLLFNTGTGTFAPASNLTVGGTGPLSVAIGDLNGDGKSDLALACIGSNSVQVLLGLGGGAFAAASSYGTGASPFSIALADLNADGKLDMVTADEGSAAVSVWLGNGAGAFGTRTPFPVGSTPVGVTIRDVDADGKPDLLVANNGSASVSLLRGTGTGSFLGKVDFATGSGPFSIAVADFNGDNKLDLAVSNYSANSLSILLGDGIGGFGAKTDFPTGAHPATVVAKDFDGDGAQDLAVGNDNSSTVSVLPGLGTGLFGARTDLSTGGYPKGVAAADLNGDFKPDLVVASEEIDKVYVFIGSSGVATSTSLSTAPNPSQYGQSVALTATVTPSAATGQVEFFDGATSLGTAPLNAGTAVLSNATLVVGTHALTASYGGDPTYDISTSPAVGQVVTKVGSTLSLSSNGNPSQFTQPVRFTATIQPATSGGTVQFKIDGVSAGGAKPVVGGIATSDDQSTLSIGSHIIDATYSGDANTFPSTASSLTQIVASPSPTIVAVRDVPNDQGGHAFITWRSPLDKPGVRVVTGYRIWRRAPNPFQVAVESGAEAVSVRNVAASRWRSIAAPDGLAETFWEAIATLPAEQLISYAYDAPTTQDSIAGSNPYTAFFVTALTADPFVFFESAVDSGYSVDNLSPPAPIPFVATYLSGSTSMHWRASRAADFREFRLYRGLNAQFVPGPANLVAATSDTAFVDPTSTPYVYKLAAMDIHGNASRYAVVTPDGPVSNLISVVDVTASSDDIRVVWLAMGNEGLAVTVYRRTLESAWLAVADLLADGNGYLRYDDDRVVTGTRYGYRLGIRDGGAEVFFGEVWATANPAIFDLAGARPNPGRSGAMRIAFSLPNPSSAHLEVLDVSGRRITDREVGGLGSGLHTVQLAPGRIAPGIYLVRLTQGHETRVIRAVVLE